MKTNTLIQCMVLLALSLSNVAVHATSPTKCGPLGTKQGENGGGDRNCGAAGSESDSAPPLSCPPGWMKGPLMATSKKVECKPAQALLSCPAGSQFFSVNDVIGCKPS